MFLRSNYSDNQRFAQYSGADLGAIEISTTDTPRTGQPINDRPFVNINDPGILSQSVDHAVDFIRAAIADYRKTTGYEGKISVVPWPQDEFSTARYDILDQISDLSWDESDHAESIDESRMEVDSTPQVYLVWDTMNRRIGSVVSHSEDAGFRKAFDELPGAQTRIQKVSHMRAATLTDRVRDQSSVYNIKDRQGLTIETRVATSSQSAISQYNLHAHRGRLAHDARVQSTATQANIARQHWLNNGQRRPEPGIPNENWAGWVSHLIKEGGQAGQDQPWDNIGRTQNNPAWQFPDGSTLPDRSASADFGIWQPQSDLKDNEPKKITSEETDMESDLSP